MTLKGRKSSISKNSPYPLSYRRDDLSTGYLSSQRSRHSSISQSKNSASISHESHPKSRAPTLATTAETTASDAAHSGAGTSATAANTLGDRNSTFSSPCPSLRSMTTTLTTIQSTAPPLLTPSQPQPHNPTFLHSPNLSSAVSQPASAIPAHLAPHLQPTTYQTATANNVLTDDASILTLASSSKRRRRNSLDTNASVRALAPASMFGGSRESLPLSVLSGHIIQADNASIRDVSSSMGHTRPPLGGERASLISTSGVTAPALASERNSYIGTRGDGASVKSGLPGRETGVYHGRTDSMTGSIGA